MSQTQNPVATLQAKVTKTATFNGTAVDISAYPTGGVGPVVTIKVDALTAAKSAVLALQDSADNFSSDVRTVFTWPLIGALESRAPQTKVVHSYDMLGVRYGVASSKLRLAVLSIDGSTSIDYEAWIQGQS